MGPSARLVIRAESVIVDNIFTRHVVPRSMVEGVDVLEPFGIHLILKAGNPILVRAVDWVDAGSAGRASRRQVRQATELTELVNSIPPALVLGEAKSSIRKSSVGIALLIVVGFVSSGAYIFGQPNM